MIFDYMQLNSMNDCRTWAQNMHDGELTESDEERLAQWIWANKPQIGVTYKDHPIYALDGDDFYALLDE